MSPYDNPQNYPAVGPYSGTAYFIREGEIVGKGRVHFHNKHRISVEPIDDAAKAVFANHHLFGGPNADILGVFAYPAYNALTGEPATTFLDEPPGQHFDTIVVGVLEYEQRMLPSDLMWKINFR